MASTLSVANETTSVASRYTKDGEKITYEMHVLQQPERARACGSGAKSSADRRPVDPPPIVRLRVLKDGVDATFAYNANFFLFATLENARPIAAVRGAPSPAATPCVLTGTPVAGMAYLDRPAAAGYFVFPDLSVRHEGRYRLSFSLYEELKEQRDMDTEQITNLEILSQTANPAHVSHRLEVKSQPFTVFSAKKFPGLSESTSLSRLVAEQGCRVRIRRDVRMRRRETKGTYKDDAYDGSSERKHSQTPDAYGNHNAAHSHSPFDGNDRQRSTSNEAGNHDYNSAARRLSQEQNNQSYQHPYQQISQPSQPAGVYSMDERYAQGQQKQPYQNGPVPPAQHSQMPYMQQPPYNGAMPQQQMSVQHANGAYGYNIQQQQPVSQNTISHSHISPPQGVYDLANQHVRQPSVEHPITPGPYRRASMPADQHQQNPQYHNMSNVWSDHTQSFAPNQPYGQASQPFAQVDANNSYNTQATPHSWNPNSSWDDGRSQHFTGTSGATGNMPTLQSTAPTTQHMQPLAPLRVVAAPMAPPTASASTASPSSGVSSHSPSYSDVNTASSRSSIVAIAPLTAAAQQASGSKRTFSATFDTQHMEQPLRYGARPDANAQGHIAPRPSFHSASSDDGMDAPDLEAMRYRRADGTERRRRAILS